MHARNKTITVRFDQHLYEKVIQHEMSNSDLIRKSVKQYFRAQEPNSRIFNEGKTFFYNQDYIDLLTGQIQDLRMDKEYFKSKADALLLVKMPLLQRVVQRLKAHEKDIE